MDEEGAICDSCGNRIGPMGCCATVRKLLSDRARAKEIHTVNFLRALACAQDQLDRDGCESTLSADALRNAATHIERKP